MADLPKSGLHDVGCKWLCREDGCRREHSRCKLCDDISIELQEEEERQKREVAEMQMTTPWYCEVHNLHHYWNEYPVTRGPKYPDTTQLKCSRCQKVMGKKDLIQERDRFYERGVSSEQTRAATQPSFLNGRFTGLRKQAEDGAKEGRSYISSLRPETVRDMLYEIDRLEDYQSAFAMVSSGQSITAARTWLEERRRERGMVEA